MCKTEVSQQQLPDARIPKALALGVCQAELVINKNKKEKSEHAIMWQVFLSKKQTCVIIDALKAANEVIDDDFIIRADLIEWFEVELANKECKGK